MDTEHVGVLSEACENKVLLLKDKLMKKTVLDSFTELTKDKEILRIRGALALIKHLSQNDDEEKNSNELQYALDRLVRGVGSSRITGRAGFYTALVGLLSTNTRITVSNVREIIGKQLCRVGSNSKGESADIYTGQILVCGALIRSDALAKSSPEEQKSIIHILINAGKKRSYLVLAAYSFLINYLEKISEDDFRNILWPALKEDVGKQWPEQTIDTVHFLVCAQNKFPNVVKNKFVKKHLGSSELICEESLQYISDFLMTVPMLMTLQHPFYEMFCKIISKSEHLVHFWNLVDQQMVKSTRNKELISVTLLTYILENLEDASVIPDLITPNFLSLILKRLPLVFFKKDDEYVKKVQLLFEALVKKVQVEEVTTKTKISVLKKLMLSPGDFMFEKITGSKVIQLIILSLDSHGVKKLSKICREVLIAKRPKKKLGLESKWVNAERVYAAQLLSRLLGLQTMRKENEWRVEQLKFLLHLGVFTSVDGDTICPNNDGNIGRELAGSIKDSFFHSLHHKLSTLEDLRGVLSSLIHHCNELIVNSQGTESLHIELSGKTLESWHTMFKFVQKFEKKTKGKHINILPIFHIMFLHMGLQLFNETELAQSSLLELQSCYERFKNKNNESRESLKEGDDESGEPDWIEVVVDLFLSLLSHNSHLLRSLVRCVFPLLCQFMNTTAIYQILAVLDPKNEENPLTVRTELDLDDSESSSDEDSTPEDNGDVQEESEDSASEFEDDDCNDKVVVSDQLKMAVREALGGAAVETDQESVDIDDINEEEGLRLDTALAKAFKLLNRSRSGKKSLKQKKEDELLTHFRVRVMDLIDIYLDREPTMHICLEILVPLFQTLEFCITGLHQKPLENRINSCLKKLVGMKKFSSTDGVDERVLTDILKSLMEKQSRSSTVFQNMSFNIAECCTFIVRCSQIISPNVSLHTFKKTGSSIVEVYKEGLLNFFKNENRFLLPAILFDKVLRLVWNGNWLLAPILIDCAFDKTVRQFNRTQALHLLSTLYNNSRLLITDVKTTTKQLKIIEKDLSERTISSLKATVQSEEANEGITEKFVEVLLNLFVLIRNCHKKNELKDIPNVIDWESVTECLQKYISDLKTVSKTTKLAYKIFTGGSKIGTQNGVVCKNVEKQEVAKGSSGKRQRLDSDGGVSDAKCKNSKKRQKIKAQGKDKRLLREQGRLLRLEASSAGLEFVSFSQVPLGNILDNDNKNSAENDLGSGEDNSNNKNTTKRKSSDQEDISDFDRQSSEDVIIKKNAKTKGWKTKKKTVN